ncbi:MAG: response regulator [Oligoflexia bacterium]|nr:response regulator [Oligoflexia bacterium]
MSLKFLVVDDDQHAREIMKMILQSMDCSVETAPDGLHAIKMLHSEKRACEFDAIFLDIVMPSVSGYEVLEMLKSNRETRNIPVILLSAVEPKQELIKSYQKGADYFVPKPFTVEQIIFGLDLMFGTAEAP